MDWNSYYQTAESVHLCLCHLLLESLLPRALSDEDPETQVCSAIWNLTICRFSSGWEKFLQAYIKAARVTENGGNLRERGRGEFLQVKSQRSCSPDTLGALLICLPVAVFCTAFWGEPQHLSTWFGGHSHSHFCEQPIQILFPSWEIPANNHIKAPWTVCLQNDKCFSEVYFVSFKVIYGIMSFS